MIIDNPKISGSLEVQNHISASDGTITGNLIVQGNVVGTASTASYVESANVDGLTNLSSSIASGLLKNTTDTLTGDLTVTGNITAQEFHTEYVSASVIYESGSTQFGDTLDDTHNFTGSINLTGSLNVNGAEVGTGKLDETVFNAYTSSADTSFNSYTSSTDTSIQNLTDETSSYALKAEISGSNTTLSSSVASDIEDILDGTDTVTSASYALTASYADSGAGFPFDGAAIITGSLYVSGSTISGSFVGDGSQLTDIVVSQESTVTSSFSAVSTLTVNHNFNSKNVSVAVYNSSDVQVLPAAVTLTDNDNVKIDFAGNTAGYAVVSKGGHIVSGSLSISETGHISDSFTSQTSHTVFHGFNTKEVIVSVYEGDNLIIPDSVTTNNLDSVTVSFPEAISGRVVVVKGGHLISGSIGYSNISNKPTLLSGSAQIANDISGSFTSLSSSLESRVSDQESFSSSLDATFATDADLNLVSSSVDSLNAATSSYALANQISGSFTSLSSSIASELLKNTTDTLTGDLTVTGTLTAQDLHVQEVTSSILYSSGSNILGASSSDTQILYGNVGIGTTSNFSGSELDVWGNITLAQQNWAIRGNGGNANFAIEELAGGAFNDNNITLQIISGGNTLITNGWVPTNSSKLVVRGSGTYNTTFSRAGSTIQIISDELSDDTWSPVFNIANIRQSLTTGRDSFGGIGFSSIDDSNNDGMTDAARIALVNESPASVVTPTALAFYTNAGTATTGSATEQMRIDSSGNVGIGTTSPDASLDIEPSSGDADILLTAGSQTLRLDQNSIRTTTNSNLTLFTNGNSNQLVLKQSNGNVGIGGSPTNRFSIKDGSNVNFEAGCNSDSIFIQSYNRTSSAWGDIVFNTNGETMRIDSSGNVGIGTTSPDLGAVAGTRVLTIASPTAERWGILELAGNRTWGGNQVGELKFISTDSTNNGTLVSLTAINDPSATGTGGSLKFSTRPNGGSLTERMRIDSAGVISIGPSTTSSEIYFNYNNTNNKGGLKIDYSTGELRLSAGESGNGYHQAFYTNGSERMRITSGGDITVSGGDIFLNSGTNYNDKGVVYISNERTAIISDIVNATANGDTSLDFQTRSGGTRASAMFIDEFRNVGIGNTNPLAKLQITSGDSGASSPWSNADELVLESSGNAGLAFQTPNTGAATIAFQDPESVQAGFIQYLHGDNAMRFATNGNNIRMLINSSGYVGIGTTSPSAPVHIKSAIEGMLWLDSSGNSASLQFRDNGTIRGLIGFSNGSSIYAGADDHDMVLRSESKMHFVSATSVHGISIDANGKVGIGTTSPNAKLQVDSATAGNVTGAYFTNSQANSGAEKVSIAFGLNRSGGDFIRSTQAITFGSEQQWTGTPASVRGYLQFNTMQDESEGARMRISSQGLISSQNTVTSHSRRRDYTYTGTVNNGDTVDLIENSSAYTDVTFILFLEIFHSGRTYRVIKGSFGGYGLNQTSSGSGIGITQQTVATGRAKLQISNTTGYSAGVHLHAIIIGDSSITVHNGVLATAPQ